MIKTPKQANMVGEKQESTLKDLKQIPSRLSEQRTQLLWDTVEET